MYGKKARLPLELDDIANETDIMEEVTECQMQQRMESFCELTKVRDGAKRNLERAQGKQKQYYDKLHNSFSWNVGDKVLVINSRQRGRKGDKLAKRLHGPYTIREVLPKGAFKLDGMKQIVNSSRLTKYVEAQKLRGATEQDWQAHSATSTDAEHHEQPSPQPIATSKQQPDTVPASLDVSCVNQQSTDTVATTNNVENPKQQPETVAISLNAEHTEHQLPQSMITVNSRKRIIRRLGLEMVRQCSFGKVTSKMPPDRLYRIRGDGNCFFRAVAYAITGSEDKHHALRQMTVTHMLGPIKSDMERYMHSDLHRYIAHSRMGQAGVWATDSEIYAAASLLQMDILVFAKYGNTFAWMAFPASLKLGEWGSEAIFLDNSSGVHFDVVISCMK